MPGILSVLWCAVKLQISLEALIKKYNPNLVLPDSWFNIDFQAQAVTLNEFNNVTKSGFKTYPYQGAVGTNAM